MRPIEFARALALTAALLAGTFPRLAHADPALEWNLHGITAAVAANQSPVVSSRTMALMHAALFDARNAIERRYTAYAYRGEAPAGASADAAAAAAAHAVLLQLVPTHKEGHDKQLAQSLAAVADGPGKSAGVAFGNAVGQALLKQRADDGFGAPNTYRPPTAPGVYVPTALPVGGDLPGSRPLVLERADQFRPGPPPELTSTTWTQALAETAAIGGRAGTTRTAEQTEVARFWIVTGAPANNPVIRAAVIAKGLKGIEAARTFALAHLAAYDALVAVFDAKYAYNFWRPVTAVRASAKTPADTAWLPLVDAPMHPEYPCAHCINAGAVAAVLQALLGEPGSLAMTSPTLPGVERRWTRLSDYATEVSNARIWSGVHYRFSTEVGARMGRAVGEFVVGKVMRPV
jgi:hypothetical protein